MAQQSEKTVEEIKAEVLASVKQGEFVADLDRHRWPLADGQFPILARATADLQNDGTTDFLAFATDEVLDGVERQAFFDLHLFFCEFIPLIAAPANVVVPVVERLFRKAGNDGIAGQAYNAFRAWCENGDNRPDEALDFYGRTAGVGATIPSIALQVGAKSQLKKYFDEALQFVGSDSSEKRLAGAVALGRFDFAGHDDLRRDAFMVLQAVWAAGDDPERSSMISSIMDLNSRAHDLSGDTQALLDRMVNPGPLELHAIATALLLHRKTLTARMVETMLGLVAQVKRESAGTIDVLDMALSQLWAEHSSGVSEYLECVLTRKLQPLQMETFDGLEGAILSGPPDAFNQLALRWLSTGQFRLGDALARIVQRTGEDNYVFRLDMSDCSDPERLFIARKAVGSFMLQPVTASSVVVCAMRTASEGTLGDLSALLFDPVLVNFTGAREKLEASISTTDAAYLPVKAAFALHDSYLETLSSVGELPELYPSERQRRAAHEKNRAWQTEIMKAAEKRSVLMSIIDKTVVLYGDRTIDYVSHRKDEAPRRIESRMQPHTTSWEWPRLDTIDPVGLSHLIYRLRAEPKS